MKKDDEEQALLAEYNALKKHLGNMLLEHTNENPEDVAYYTRKFNELRQRLNYSMPRSKK